MKSDICVPILCSDPSRSKFCQCHPHHVTPKVFVTGWHNVATVSMAAFCLTYSAVGSSLAKLSGWERSSHGEVSIGALRAGRTRCCAGTPIGQERKQCCNAWYSLGVQVCLGAEVYQLKIWFVNLHFPQEILEKTPLLQKVPFKAVVPLAQTRRIIYGIRPFPWEFDNLLD